MIVCNCDSYNRNGSVSSKMETEAERLTVES